MTVLCTDDRTNENIECGTAVTMCLRWQFANPFAGGRHQLRLFSQGNSRSSDRMLHLTMVPSCFALIRFDSRCFGNSTSATIPHVVRASDQSSGGFGRGIQLLRYFGILIGRRLFDASVVRH